MIPVKITEETVFTEGYMGLKEPMEYDENISLSTVDISVIPCVSASLSGERLGHGGGFYDIFLKKTQTKKICLCFHKLILKTIPTDEHDILMDTVITEKEIFPER